MPRLGDQITRVRRSRSLVADWQGGEFRLQNYLTQKSTPAAPLVLEILTYCAQWRTLSEVLAAFSAVSRRSLRRLLRLLMVHSFLDRTRGAGSDREPLEGWSTWTPEAAFFHFATKDAQYRDLDELHAELVKKAAVDRAPAPIKPYTGAQRMRAGPTAPVPSLSALLDERRTWRRFGKPASVDLEHVSTLLSLTWGVRGWAQTELGPSPLKTSPSGGARHPIEVYLMARTVSGVAPGCYYYDPDAHELVVVKRGLTAKRVEISLGGQSCYAQAPAVFVMTAVFARTQWRYEFPRAYRVVLLDAGHLCQTFCLVATALGLAPFCTAALADSLLEQTLGLDGINESVIYACGVGRRPGEASWAPWPDDQPIPDIRPPKWRQ